MDKKNQKETIAELKLGWQRTQADFENYKNKVEQDKTSWAERGKIEMLERLLPILDNITLALAHAPKESDAEQWIGGIRHIVSQIDATLQELQIEKIEPQSKSHFDPAIHESLGHEILTGCEEGSITRVERLGYKIGSTLIRPAQVYLCAKQQKDGQKE
jgi:molecular chaperone GrpE